VPPTKSPPPGEKKAFGLEQVCVFMIVFSGYLFFRGPAVKPAQLAFRVGLLVVGVAGLIVLRARKKAGR
jgi:hypothetical protein